MKVDSKKLLFLISLGSVLEYYDFAVFIYLAPFVGKTLIPASNPWLNLFLSYAIFSIGALCRPLGGFIFSHLGDTRGRKYTFVYTILLMALPTLGIALIPSASVIGAWATVLLIFLRIFQGLSLGGEIPGSIVCAYELSSAKKKAFHTAIVIMGTNIGFFAASVICTFLIGLPLVAFENWRLAFLLGGAFGVGSYFLRRSLVETPAFTEYKQLLEYETVPVKALFLHHKKSLLQILGIGCFLSSSLAIFTYYMPNYLSEFYHLPLQLLMKFNSYTILIFLLGSFTAGMLDRYFGKKFFLWFSVGLSCASGLLFFNYGNLSVHLILCFHSLLLLGIGVICGRFPVLVASFFPVSVRYTGVAFIYNISFGVVAGSTQMFLTWLIKVTGLLWFPALYLCLFAALAIAALLTIKPQQFSEYQE